MIKDETLDYLGSLHGGDWSTDEKREKLYELVVQCSKEFPAPLLSVEIGCFAGVSAFCMAHAHKDLQNGFVVTIDSWDNITPLEGTNSEGNNNWWKTLDIKSVFNAFLKSKERPEWSGYVNYLKGRSDSFAENFKDESITLFHQDGNHNVETITKELELWSKKVKTGGYWVADDTNWLEAIDGYAKLPSFGFELIEDFTTWQIWKKVGVKKVEPTNNSAATALPNVTGFATIEEASASEKETIPVSSDSPPEGSFADMVIKSKQQTEEKIIESSKPNTSPVKAGAIRLGNLDVKPMMIYIPDTPEWKARGEKGLAHFKEQGIDNVFVVTGIHGEKSGIAGRHIYLADGRPEEQYYIGHGKVAGALTQYISFVAMDAMDYTHFWSTEDDLRLPEGWRERMNQALMDVPSDFDILFAASCCAGDKVGIHVKGDIWHYPYRGKDKWNWFPQCSHSLIIAKKAVRHLIETNRTFGNPSDVALVLNSFPKLNVYAILPRVGEQENTYLAP